MSFQAKRELLVQVAPRYQDASHSQKSQILDEFVAATGYVRKYAIRILTSPVSPPAPIKRVRARRYDQAVQDALAVAWAAANCICGKRLVPFLPELVPVLEQHGHLQLSAEARTLLLALSPATADRLLAGWQLLIPSTEAPSVTDEPTIPTSSAGDSPALVATHTVVVEPGDTLSAIAGRELGDAREWPRLWGMNLGHHFGNRTFDVPKEAITLDQSGCKYHPHVMGVMAGQTIKIVNSDPTTHNIHPTPKDNREWNESQPPQAAALEKTFAREELMLPVKCNQHPWMRMFVNVTKSPFYAVTGPDGKYEIKGLPPGDYTIAFVQEKMGEQTMKVTLAAKDSKTVDATFKP